MLFKITCLKNRRVDSLSLVRNQKYIWFFTYERERERKKKVESRFKSLIPKNMESIKYLTAHNDSSSQLAASALGFLPILTCWEGQTEESFLYVDKLPEGGQSAAATATLTSVHGQLKKFLQPYPWVPNIPLRKVQEALHKLSLPGRFPLWIKR